jgi:hypothetical protein
MIRRSDLLAWAAGLAAIIGADVARASCTIHGPGAAPAYGAFAEGTINNSYGVASCTPGTASGAYYFGTDINTLTYDGSPAIASTSGSTSTSYPANQSSASVSLATGAIAVSVTSVYYPPFAGALPASATAGYFVSFEVAGATPGSTGTITIGGDLTYSGDISVTSDFFLSEGSYQGLGGGYNLASGQDISATDAPWSESQGFTIEPGVVYTLAVSLTASASGQFEAGSVTATDPLSIDLPQGAALSDVSYAGFLSGAPEPSAWTMMLAGLAALGGALRARRSSAPRSA